MPTLNRPLCWIRGQRSGASSGLHPRGVGVPSPGEPGETHLGSPVRTKAAYVFTNDLSITWRMAEGLEAGIIGINDPVPATPQCPFGGMKESGLGRELGHEGLETYLETKYVSFKLREN